MPPTAPPTSLRQFFPTLAFSLSVFATAAAFCTAPLYAAGFASSCGTTRLYWGIRIFEFTYIPTFLALLFTLALPHRHPLNPLARHALLIALLISTLLALLPNYLPWSSLVELRF